MTETGSNKTADCGCSMYMSLIWEPPSWPPRKRPERVPGYGYSSGPRISVIVWQWHMHSMHMHTCMAVLQIEALDRYFILQPALILCVRFL